MIIFNLNVFNVIYFSYLLDTSLTPAGQRPARVLDEYIF
jgi:hypothetical protein